MASDWKTSFLEPLLRRGKQGPLGGHTEFITGDSRLTEYHITLQYSKFLLGHRKFTAWIKQLKLKTQIMFPSVLHLLWHWRWSGIVLLYPHLIWLNLVSVGWITCRQTYVTALKWWTYGLSLSPSTVQRYSLVLQLFIRHKELPELKANI